MKKKKAQDMYADLGYALIYLRELEKYPDNYKLRERAIELIVKVSAGVKAEMVKGVA